MFVAHFFRRQNCYTLHFTRTDFRANYFSREIWNLWMNCHFPACFLILFAWNSCNCYCNLRCPFDGTVWRVVMGVCNSVGCVGAWLSVDFICMVLQPIRTALYGINGKYQYDSWRRNAQRHTDRSCNMMALPISRFKQTVVRHGFTRQKYWERTNQHGKCVY